MDKKPTYRHKDQLSMHFTLGDMEIGRNAVEVAILGVGVTLGYIGPHGHHIEPRYINMKINLFRALNEEIFGLITELYLQYWLIEEQ